MSRRFALGLAAGLVLVMAPSVGAGAAPADPRIRMVDYDPAKVVKLTGALRTATQVLFGAGETIQHVALGDAAAWEVAAEGGILFLKPKAARPPTNLIVTTTGSAGPRHYLFELSVGTRSSARQAGAGVFGVRFRYPTAAAARLAGAAAAWERRLLELKLDRAAATGPRNLSYAVQGAPALAPSEVSDNGRFTVLRFPGAQALPALYQVDAGGTEALVPFDVRGEFVVVHGVMRQLRLRRGRQVLCVFNQAYAPQVAGPQTGTAAGDVLRTDRPGARP